jgi:hypothetical protein
MAGSPLPRRWFSWVLRWWQSHFSPRRRPLIREQKPYLETLETRFVPGSLLSVAPLGPAPALNLASLDGAARASSTIEASAASSSGVTPAVQIQLSPLPQANSNTDFAPTNASSSSEPSFSQQFWPKQDSSTLDNSLSSPPARRSSTSADASGHGSNATNAQAAAGGGTGPAGPSTPNAGGGGGGGGGAAGPAVTNASQWLSANLGSASSPAATAPAAAGAANSVSGPAASQAVPAAGNAVHTPASAGTPPQVAALAATHSSSAAAASGTAPNSRSASSSASGGDPLYVLDMNNGETVPANVTLNSFSNWSENLLAQVSGASVTNYSWDLSQAPDLTSVSGTTTANLQGTWANFSGAARTDTITVTETSGFFTTLSQTMTFLVASTGSPAYAASRPTTSTSWPSVVTPDQLFSQQATASGGPNASLGLVDGSVQTSFSMPSCNPNADPLQLDYSSTAANAQPIFLVHYQLPSTLPTTVTAQLTLNSTLRSTVSYNPSSLNPGDWMQMALQTNATGLATGRYPWQVNVYDGTSTVTYSGNVDIVNHSGSPYGAGWSLGNVDRADASRFL